MFGRKQETPAAERFDELTDEIIGDLEAFVEEHTAKLNELREAIRNAR